MRQPGSEGEHAQRVLALLADAVIVIGADLTIRWANGALRGLLGYEPGQMIGRSVLDLIPATEVADAAEAVAQQASGQIRRRPAMFHARHADGTLVPVETLGAPAFDDELVRGTVVVLRATESRGTADDERRQLERVVARAAVECLSAANDDAFDAIDRMLTLYRETIGADFVELVIGKSAGAGDSAAGAHRVVTSATGDEPSGVAEWMPTRPTYLSLDVGPLTSTERDLLGRRGLRAMLHVPVGRGSGMLRSHWRQSTTPPTAYMYLHQALGDVLTGTVQRVESQAELEHQVRRDPLTGVANRLALQERIVAAQAGSGFDAVVFCDIDDFKSINDAYGHHVGDLVLIECARRLEQCARAGDLVARIGGDEFVVVAHVGGDEGARKLRTRLRAVLDEPFVAGDEVFAVRVSVGLVLGRDATSFNELLALADREMYADKQSTDR